MLLSFASEAVKNTDKSIFSTDSAKAKQTSKFAVWKTESVTDIQCFKREKYISMLECCPFIISISKEKAGNRQKFNILHGSVVSWHGQKYYLRQTECQYRPIIHCSWLQHMAKHKKWFFCAVIKIMFVLCNLYSITPVAQPNNCNQFYNIIVILVSASLLYTYHCLVSNFTSTVWNPKVVCTVAQLYNFVQQKHEFSLYGTFHSDEF